MYQKQELTYNSLEPYISDRTLMIHYNNYYLKYLKNLNDLLIKENYDFKYKKEELFDHIDKFNLNNRNEILYNLGGVVNHELYFFNISDLKNNIPVGSIKKDIDLYYGNYENFKKEFKKMALELVGSGYTYLVINKNKSLQIINMSNEESPYIYGMIPIITIDLFEHAYYLDYQNNKEKYIDAFFEIIDFNKINNLYEKEKNKI